MKLTLEGDRQRLYAERKKVQAQEGNPIHDDVSISTRRRIVRELLARVGFTVHGGWMTFTDYLLGDLRLVFERAPGGYMFIHDRLGDIVQAASLDEFLQILEAFAARIVKHRPVPEEDLGVFQSLLADDLSAYRLVNVGMSDRPLIHVQKIDNEHLHREIVDRTFELTRVAQLASSQGDYADAWRHYRKGDLDNALTDAHKAVESACKAVVKKTDPTSTPDDMQLGQLVSQLVQHNIIPQELNHVCGQLEQIFRGAGSLRNQAGAAHGSLDPTTPAASTTLLGLRLSGTLIAFLAERWEQIKQSDLSA